MIPEAFDNTTLPPIFISNDYSLSYQEVFSIIYSTALKLEEENKNIAVLCDNSPESALLILAIIHSGSRAAMLNIREGETSISEQLNNVGCDIMITDRKDFSLPGIKVVNIADLISIPKCSELPKDIQPEIGTRPGGTIFFTSGSSGRAKAVFHEWGQHIKSAAGANENIPLEIADRYLLSLPLYHVGGFAILIRCLISGASVFFPAKNGRLEETIIDNGITHISLVETQLKRLLETEKGISALKQLKHILVGGGPVSGSLIKASIENGLKLHTSYGSTEMASQICTTSTYNIEELKTSGRVLKYREIEIDDSREILVKGQTLFRGYISEGKIIKNIDNEGWYHTGDCGYFDSNKRLIVTGRIDNMFISGGENIHPEEIEKALTSLEFVDFAVVIPVADDEFGKRPIAYIKTDMEIPSREEFKNLLQGKLAPFKIPDRFYPVPKNYQQKGIKPDRHFFRSLFQKQ